MNCLFKFATLLIITDVIGSSPLLGAENLQKITFFTSADHDGESESYTEHIPHVQNSTNIARIAKSFCAEKGVWVVDYILTVAGELPDESKSEGVLVNSNVGWVCISFHNEETGQTAIYTSIRHLASNDMTATALSLFNGRFRGDELFISGDSFQLPSAILVNSTAFTGNFAWTIKTSTGELFCLPLGEYASDPYLQGLSFSEFIEPVEITGASMGCDDTTTRIKYLDSNGPTLIYPALPSQNVKFINHNHIMDVNNISIK